MVGDRAWHAWRQHERCHRTTGCRPGLRAHPADRPGALFAAAVRLSMAGGPELDFDLVVIGGGSGGLAAAFRAAGHGARVALRSEEHTSELQSLMRISYAVFCLKTTTHITTTLKNTPPNQNKA